jgi:RHS repeat-associated protein
MKHNTRHWVGITVGILSLAGYASAATRGSEKYTYDASGNIIEKSIDGNVTRMAYDRSNRLTEFQTVGQSKQTTAYDAAGRPVTERNEDGQITRSMSYGYGDKVLETQTQNTKAGFFYNAVGQLVGKNVEGTVSTYTWDGNVLAAEGSEAFANEAHISGGVPVLTSGTDVVVSDHLGNTLASGVKQFASTAYGEGLEKGRFTGKPQVNELGGYIYPYRTYSPVSNTWKTVDSSGFPNGANNYSFCSGDPINRIDPSGLEFFRFHITDVTQTNQLELRTGTGYATQTINSQVCGDVNMGEMTEVYLARTRMSGKAENLEDGVSPQGWYVIGNVQETSVTKKQADWNDNGTMRQGSMSKWGNTTDCGDYPDPSVLKTSYDNHNPDTLYHVSYKYCYGSGYMDGNNENLKPGLPTIYPYYGTNNNPRNYGTLMIHPDGPPDGTFGCVGLACYYDAIRFQNAVIDYPNKQLWIER